MLIQFVVDAVSNHFFEWTAFVGQKCYELKQYKRGFKGAEQILKKFPEHGGTHRTSRESNCRDRLDSKVHKGA